MPKAASTRDNAAPSLGRRIGRLWLVYLRGQLVCALSIGAIIWIFGSGLGLEGALWLGLFAGLMETVPHIGPLIAAVPAVIVALWHGSTVIPVSNWAFALIIAGVYIAIQQVGSLIIQPKVLGRELDLPPLVVLVAVIAGAALGGIVGLYLAVPLLVTIRELVYYAQKRRRGRSDGNQESDDVAPPAKTE